MKILLFILVLAASCLAQSRGGYREIYTETENSAGINHLFIIEAIGPVWDRGGILTETYTHNNIVYSLLYGTESFQGNCAPCWDYGFDNLVDGGPHEPDYFGLGLYKFTHQNSSKYIYLNFTDKDYSNMEDGVPIYQAIDEYVMYDGAENILMFKGAGSGLDYENATQGEVFNCWEELHKRIRQDIQNTNNLELYLIVSSQNGHPYLSWNPFHASVSGYYVHKKLTTESGTITTQHFTTSTNWIDTDFTIGSPKFQKDEVEYWITAKLSQTQQSLEGNHVTKYGTSWIQWKILLENTSNNFNYTISQNYPNPFNPTTTIEYTVGTTRESSANVKLVIYDVLGREVKTLVNNNQSAGKYRVTFDASGLASGVYYYRLQAGDFVQTRKMLLLR